MSDWRQNIYIQSVCVCVCVRQWCFSDFSLTSSVPEFKVGPAVTSQSHRAVYDMITINHSLWSGIEQHFLHHDWNAAVETKDAGPCPDWLQIAHQCVARHSFNNRGTSSTLSAMLFSSPCRQREKGKHVTLMLFTGYFAKITLWWNFKGERKKNGEGASKVALTGDRFLTCFPSHLLWVRTRRQSRIWRREKRGVRLEKMARAAGNRGNAMLTGGGGKLFICIVNLCFELLWHRVYVHGLYSRSEDTISWSCCYSCYKKKQQQHLSEPSYRISR